MEVIVSPCSEHTRSTHIQQGVKNCHVLPCGMCSQRSAWIDITAKSTTKSSLSDCGDIRERQRSLLDGLGFRGKPSTIEAIRDPPTPKFPTRLHFSLLLTLFTFTACHAPFSKAQTSFPASKDTTLSLSGHITPSEIFSFIYVPFNVSSAVTSIHVQQTYSFSGAGNALDLGIFDPHGTPAINALTGSGGCSSGFRSNFTISALDATPGYNAGPLAPGTLNVVLGPYATNRSGIDWTVSIALSSTRNESTPLWTPSYAPTNKAPLSAPTWLRGDFHAHSIYSDGRHLPSQQIANALSQDLDFMFFSEHNTDSGNENIGRWIPSDGTADNLLSGGR